MIWDITTLVAIATPVFRPRARCRWHLGLAVDAIGNLYICETFNQRIRKVGADGVITTIVGNGIAGCSGDYNLANQTQISYPRGISLDADGNLLIADWGNHRIRKVADLEYANQPSFTVTNVTGDMVNDRYSVIVTSSSGSVTSSVANLVVQLPPLAPTFVATNGSLRFQWGTVASRVYQLPSATNLSAPDWQNVGSPVTATGATLTLTNFPDAAAQRFYRVQLVP